MISKIKISNIANYNEADNLKIKEQRLSFQG